MNFTNCSATLIQKWSSTTSSTGRRAKQTRPGDVRVPSARSPYADVACDAPAGRTSPRPHSRSRVPKCAPASRQFLARPTPTLRRHRPRTRGQVAALAQALVDSLWVDSLGDLLDQLGVEVRDVVRL